MPGLRYDVSTAVDPWNTNTPVTGNPEKMGKLTVRLCGVRMNNSTVPPSVMLVDFEVLVQWTGVKGKSHYSTRLMLTKGT